MHVLLSDPSPTKLTTFLLDDRSVSGPERQRAPAQKKKPFCLGTALLKQLNALPGTDEQGASFDYCTGLTLSYRHGFVWFFVRLGPVLCSLFSLLAKRKSGREICVSSLLPCFFLLCWFFHGLPRVKPKGFILFAHFSTASHCQDRSLRARLAATGKKGKEV